MAGGVVGLPPKDQGDGGRQVVGLAPPGATTGRQVVGLAGSAAPAPAKSGGGGIGHWLGQKLDLAARDIKGIPGSVAQIAEAPVLDTVKGVEAIPKIIEHPGRDAGAENAGAHSMAVGKGIVKSTEQVAQHPLRDPFATVTTLAPFLHGIGRVGVGAVEATRAAQAGASAADVVRAATARPETIPRALSMGDQETPLIPSRGGAGRLAQMGYDKVVQKALDKNEAGKAGPISSRVAAHGASRIGAGLDEEGRIAQKMRAVPAQLLDRAAGKLSKTPAARRQEQAALELASANTTAEDAAAFHRGQAEKGVNPRQNTAVANLYQRVADRGLLTQDEHGNVVVNSADHPKLAAADEAMQRLQNEGDQTLVDKGVRDEAALATRRNAPAQIREGATYEKPTPSKQGISPALIKATAARDRLATLHGKALEQEQAWMAKQPAKIAETGTRTGGPSLPLDNPFRERINNLGSALEVANQRVDTLARQAEARVKPTGIVGGETARPGRGFVSYRTSEKRLSKAETSGSPGPVVGAAKAPIDSKTFTGRSIEQGLVPKNVTSGAAQHFRQIVKFVNTDERRRAALRTGNDVKRSSRDVLVRMPDEKAKPLTPDMLQNLGKEHSTIDDVGTLEGLNAAHEAFREGMFRPGELKAKFAGDRAAGIGAKAPDGYRWVDKKTLGDLAAGAHGEPTWIGKTLNNVNSAITAATVYFKVGHIGTRVLTNAATNIIQGSAKPHELAASYEMWERLSPEERARALAAGGQHGFAALPQEGAIGKVAGKGAQFWARHADAPFRFNALAYELRQIGIKTPDKFTQALDALERNGQRMPAHEWSKLSAAARRTDREAISYDRLNDFERRYIARAVWFYPWVKGSTLFTARTAIEHPFKTAVLGAAGSEGRQKQEQTLGPTPSYEAGLLSLGGGATPLTTDFSTFSPFATSADVLEGVARPGGYAGFLNPAAGAVGQLAYGLNQYGSASKTPYTDALLALAASTPEQQLAEAQAAQKADQSKKMFPKSTGGTVLRYLVGPAMPRKVNRTALAKAAARERSGQR